MASPQIENGHIDIANTIADKLCSYRLSGQEWQIIWVVLRKTWGWLENPKDKSGPKKKLDRISFSQFEQFTGVDRRRCHAVLKKLIKKKILKKSVTKKGDKLIISYGFQKNFDLWKLSPKKVTVTKKDNGVSPKKTTGLSPKKTHTKETSTKETSTKETINVEDFPNSLSLKLLNHIKLRNDNFKNPDIKKWAQQIDQMIRLDKRNPLEIFIVIEWCQESEFWQNNILSTHKLRKQYDQLKMKMAQSKNSSFHNKLIKRGQQWLKKTDPNS